MLALDLSARGIGPRRVLRPRGFGLARHGLWAGHQWIVLVVIAILIVAFVLYRRRRR